MRLDFIRLAEHDVDAAAVGLPPRDAGGEMLVGVGNALVMFFLEFVLFGVRRGIAALPKRFNKVVALFVVGQLLESRSLFIGNDVRDVFVEPFLVRLAQFLLEGAGILLSRLLIRGALQGVNRIRRLLSSRFLSIGFVGSLGILRLVFGLVLGHGDARH